MTDRPLGLRERNRIRTRDEILAAMSVLLGERSFEAITVDDVGQRAGVSRGTIYSYFPEGREQLVRDAYLRIAEAVVAEGAERRNQETDVVDRVLALASTLVGVATTPEGRFYGMLGSATFGPLGGVTGTASGRFLEMLVEDLESAQQQGRISSEVPAADTGVLLSGALRETAATAAKQADRAEPLLAALRATCEALLKGA